MQTSESKLKLAASVVVTLFAALGCATRTKKSAEKDARGPGQTDEPVATSAAAAPVARAPNRSAEEVEAARSTGEEDTGEPLTGEAGPRPGRGSPEGRDLQPAGRRGMAAVRHAAEAGKYLFVFFQRDDDEQTRKMREVFDAAVGKVTDRAESVVIDVADPSEKEIVAKFGADRAPIPLALVLAPNGALTGGFPTRFDEKQLVGAIVSPGTEKCLKALQERKLVLLCVQNATTKSNGDAMRGVRDFRADRRYTRATEIITLDPADAKEAEFLRRLRIDPKSDEAITAFLAPPGTVIAKLKGATDKDAFVAALEACGSDCGPSSGSTGAG